MGVLQDYQKFIAETENLLSRKLNAVLNEFTGELPVSVVIGILDQYRHQLNQQWYEYTTKSEKEKQDGN